jgi:hypothetical protein
MQRYTVGISSPYRTAEAELTRVRKVTPLGHSEECPRDGSLKAGGTSRFGNPAPLVPSRAPTSP